jgi:hypothetical protein
MRAMPIAIAEAGIGEVPSHERHASECRMLDVHSRTDDGYYAAFAAHLRFFSADGADSPCGSDFPALSRRRRLGSRCRTSTSLPQSVAGVAAPPTMARRSRRFCTSRSSADAASRALASRFRLHGPIACRAGDTADRCEPDHAQHCAPRHPLGGMFPIASSLQLRFVQALLVEQCLMLTLLVCFNARLDEEPSSWVMAVVPRSLA